MAALQERRGRLLDSLYEAYGEPAVWTPADGGAAVTVTVRRRSLEAAVAFGGTEALASACPLKVRTAEIAQPLPGDLVAVLDPDTGETVATYRIDGDPQRVKTGGEWACDTAEIPA